jgi:hypothetical protein
MTYEARCIDCGSPFQRTQRARSHRCLECQRAAPLKRWAAFNAKRKTEAAEARGKLVCQFELCGRPLEAQRSTRRYCSDRCRRSAYRRAHSWMPAYLRGDAG